MPDENQEHLGFFALRSSRMWICFLTTIGLYTTVSMRLNLSMAVVCMAKSTPQNSSSHEGKCGVIEVDEAQAGYTGDLDWSPTMQSMLLSATFYGAIVTISFSGTLADKFGSKKLLLFSALTCVLVTIVTPFLATRSFTAFFIARVLMGLGEGFIFPSIGSLASSWFSATERSTAAAVYTSGIQIAAASTSFVGAQLCNSQFGWPAIFYLYGAIGTLWCAAWVVFATSSPASNRWTSSREKAFLERNAKSSSDFKKKRNIPWRALLRSKPLWAAIFCQYTFNAQGGMLQAFLPMFLKEQLGLPIHRNGLFTMIPFATQLISKNVCGPLADYLRRHGHLEKTTGVRVFQFVGSYGSGLAALGIAVHASCDTVGLTAFYLAAYGVFFSAGGICGFFTSILSIAPNFSGTLLSLSTFFGLLGSMTGPIILSLVQRVTSDVEFKWKIIMFSICVFPNFLFGLTFAIFGSAEEQEWNDSDKPKAIATSMIPEHSN